MTEFKKNGLLAIITGPRGVGKDALIARLGFIKIVSHTTRPPRDDETDGYDYHFVSEKIFLEMVNNDEFAEHVDYPASGGIGKEYKGTSKKELRQILEDEPCAWRIGLSAIPGVGETIRQGFSPLTADAILANTLVFYIGTPSLWDLSARLLKRSNGTLSRKERTRLIGREWQMWQQFGSLFNHVILNRDGELDKTASQILQIIKDFRSK